MSFFLASVVPRSARNWSRPPPSAISSPLATLALLLQPPWSHPSLHLLHFPFLLLWPPFCQPLFSSFSLMIFPTDLWNSRMMMSPFTFTEDPPFNSKNHLKSVMASGITRALLLVWTLSKYIWFKWSKFWIFGWDRPESPPTQEISKVEEGHDKTYNGLKFALSTFSS